MKLADLREGVDALRHQALGIQADLIDLLPDDYSVNLTNLFSSAGLYTYGQFAVKVRHSSYASLVNGEAYVFPRGGNSMTLVYSFKGEYQRQVSYDNTHELATDLEKNIQTNSV